MKIGIDVDDVITEYVAGLVDYYNHLHFDRVNINSVREWDLKKTLGKASTPDQMNALMTGFIYHSHFDSLPETPGAVKTIKQLMSEGHTPYFITSRSSKAIDSTYKWLDNKGLPIERVYFNKDKAWLTQRLGIDIHIDDGVHNLEQIAANNYHKTYTVLFDRPWNRSTPVRYSHDRVKDWNQVYTVVQSVERIKKP